MMFKLFSGDSNLHPLADAKELKRILAELHGQDDLRAVDGLSGWLESIANAEAFPLLPLLEAIRQVDEAGQAYLRRMTRAYLSAARRSASEEKRIWSIGAGYWQASADAYGVLLAAYGAGLQSKDKPKGFDQVKAQLPVLYVRRVAALAAHRKWRHFHYERAPQGVWQKMGEAYLEAQKLKADAQPVQIYPQMPGATTVTQEYIRAIALEASSLDALTPGEMELAEKLIAHFAPQFSLVEVNRADNLYWIDAALDQPPVRLAKLPKATPTVRLLGFGQAPEALAGLMRVVERGEVPSDLSLGGQYPARPVLKVLRHLASYWTAKPPLRQHHRHMVKGGLSVLRGFDACIEAHGGVVRRRADEGSATGNDSEDEFDERESLDLLPARGEGWVVENVSIGGFGASTPQRSASVAIGDLLVLQPDGGENWLIGLVRRYGREPNGSALVGVETLSKQAALLMLRQQGGGGYMVAGSADHAILLDAEVQVESVRVLLPASTFDLKESYTSHHSGQAILLLPVELLETGRDYQIGRYRLRTAD